MRALLIAVIVALILGLALLSVGADNHDLTPPVAPAASYPL